MFFRFVASLILVVLVSMVGIGLEKQTLQMKRAVSRQYFQRDVLLEMHAQLRLRIQKLTTPSQLAELEANDSDGTSPHTFSRPQQTSGSGRDSGSDSAAGATRAPKLPLLRWEHPVVLPAH